MSLLDWRRKQAASDHQQNTQTQMATEQAIRDSQQREAYNAELARQRQADFERGQKS